jgi:hypothetical protein
MKVKTITFERLLKLYKALALSITITNTCAVIFIPKWISPHVNVMSESTIRLITFIISMLLSNGLLKLANNVWTISHNEMLEKDVSTISSFMSGYCKLDREDLESLSKALNQIKEHMKENDKKEE